MEDIIGIPAIAYQSYQRLKNHPYYFSFLKKIRKAIKKHKSVFKKVSFIHQKIDESIKDLFKDPVIKENVSCKRGCSACCYTQVSVTSEEATVLADKVVRGLKIDFDLLEKQALKGDESKKWYELSYEDRKCVFLGENNDCQIYENRPSVCRTNYVVSDPSLCKKDGDESNQIQLLKTFEADMIIAAHFMDSKKTGALPSMLADSLYSHPRISKTKTLG